MTETTSANLGNLASSEAQPEAQLESLVSTTETYASELILRVLGRHGLAQKEVAIEAGIQEGALTRCLGGQQRIPIEVFRAVYRRTMDPEILAYFGDERSAIVRVDSLDPWTSPYATLVSLVQAAHAMQMSVQRALYADGLTGEEQSGEVIACVSDSLMAEILRARCYAQKHLAMRRKRAEPAPTQRLPAAGVRA